MLNLLGESARYRRSEMQQQQMEFLWQMGRQQGLV